MDATASGCHKQVVLKEEQARSSYYRSRFPGGLAADKDPYDDDRVAPLSILHRTIVNQTSLVEERRERTPLTERQAHQAMLEAMTRGQDGSTGCPYALGRRPSSPKVWSKESQAIGLGVSTAAAPGGPRQAPPVGTPSGMLTPAPATGLSRRSLSLPGLREEEPMAFAGAVPLSPLVSSAGSLVGSRGGGLAASSRRSAATTKLSRASRASLASKVSEAVQQEVARTGLGDYFASLKAAEERKRARALAMPLHLRVGPNPVDMGQPSNTVSTYQETSTRPVQMAVDPKWSTEIKKMNDRAGLMIQYTERQSGSVPGQLIPEVPHMPPKRHLSNPPTPYFRAGVKD